MLSVSGWLMYALNRSRLVAPVSFGCHRYTSAAQSAPNVLIDMVKSFIPPLTYDQHKGQSGRVAVFGGCQEYTGAPYFAAISALKLGADLSHVFCTQEAATVIKSYSPELIVHPIINSDNLSTTSEETSKWLERMHAVILGPGLGRDINTLKYAEAIIKIAKEKCLPIVIDADGLFLITQKPELVKGYKRAILTPNVAEFSRLYEKFGEKPPENEPVICVKSLAERLGNITIVQKGFSDVMSDGDKVLVCYGEGSPRRCGGQGDLLSGSMGIFTHWSHSAVESDNSNEAFEIYGPTIGAAYAACLLTRHCNNLAFKEYQRSMTTTDMINKISEAFQFLYQ
ncbi:ATP-dependent (S)-NAD(P)H-hydrate dehydratase isoform X4 [Patella vulgata]|uniref:ATP-dependent (S)-NAD(P)H-hydrate dehydratase isoform X4 n=1 Tax=Patella vulgata TaxID=6465 RepID=UPI00217FFDAA|nr:ATP-dependent (S)-NAD(P)H-hydrate dehydratase isoform X4 [Patella vulgata]